MESTKKIGPDQHRAARLAGFLYLLVIALGVFSEIYVRGQLIVAGDSAQTAANVLASETLLRLSAAADLVMISSAVVLAWALYVVLAPVHRNLALLGALLRFVEAAIVATTTLNTLQALRLLGRSDVLQAFDSEQSQALARVFLDGQGTGMLISFVFLGLASALFSVLWFRSRYVPRLLAAWGVFASLLLAGATLATLVFPSLSALEMAYMAPMGLYEIGLGGWLLVRGVRLPA